MLELGADPNAVDSIGNTCFDRLVLDANQKSDTRQDWEEATGREIGLVIYALGERGGDPRKIGHHGLCAIDWARGHPVERLFAAWREPPTSAPSAL